MSGSALLDRPVLWIACAAALLTPAIPVLGADDSEPIAQMYHSAWTAQRRAERSGQRTGAN